MLTGTDAQIAWSEGHSSRPFLRSRGAHSRPIECGCGCSRWLRHGWYVSISVREKQPRCDFLSRECDGPEGSRSTSTLSEGAAAYSRRLCSLSDFFEIYTRTKESSGPEMDVAKGFRAAYPRREA